LKVFIFHLGTSPVVLDLVRMLVDSSRVASCSFITPHLPLSPLPTEAAQQHLICTVPASPERISS
jgi:hypothetical protein